MTLWKKLEEAHATIREQWRATPCAGIILGTGLGAIAEEVKVDAEFRFEDLPHFSRATALGHRGRLLCGELFGRPVVVMQGRLHLYEGHSPRDVAFPVWLMQRLGAGVLCATNAAGGLDARHRVGDLVVLDDHINLLFRNPLLGPNDERIGPRFPDMSSPYDAELIALARQAARRCGFECQRGVYAAVLGPNYETRSEYRMLRQLGAELVGMSTAPEVIAANHAGMRSLAFSVVTNVCLPDALGKTTGAAVVAAAALAADRLRLILSDVIPALPIPMPTESA